MLVVLSHKRISERFDGIELQGIGIQKNITEIFTEIHAISMQLASLSKIEAHLKDELSFDTQLILQKLNKISDDVLSNSNDLERTMSFINELNEMKLNSDVEEIIIEEAEVLEHEAVEQDPVKKVRGRKTK